MINFATAQILGRSVTLATGWALLFIPTLMVTHFSSRSRAGEASP